MLQKCYFSPSHGLVVYYKKITTQIAQKARKAYKIYVLSIYLTYIL